MNETVEAEINPDGTASFGQEGEPQPPPPPESSDWEEAEAGETGPDDFETGPDDGAENTTWENTTFFPMEDDESQMDGTDPAVYLGVAVLVVGVLYLMYSLYQRRKKAANDDLDFFSSIDGEKFNLQLPAAVEEYYAVKAKCEEQGWEPGTPPPQGQQQTGPHRVMAQALMKRCIADIPLVQHVQKESGGMNKLYSQSMCSVKQWKSYQAAEAMVSAEVDEVRAEADEIEPGWSQVIWRQAMQYHNMLKQKHEVEAKNLAAAAEKRRLEEAKKNSERKKVEDEKARIQAAEKAAAELIKQEEREKQSKKAFKNGGGMKKGFLDSKGKKKT